MPSPAQSLTPNSSPEEIDAALKATVMQLIDEGVPQEEAVAQAMEQVRRATGQALGPRTGGPNQGQRVPGRPSGPGPQGMPPGMGMSPQGPPQQQGMARPY